MAGRNSDVFGVQPLKVGERLCIRDGSDKPCWEVILVDDRRIVLRRPRRPTLQGPVTEAA